ncbi:hypothetical protein B0H11DRAFT_1904359 [Mycena galericulata]|nr:hypothetical protein B0H11DRAFT_1904359 [Mycena galericulata]
MWKNAAVVWEDAAVVWKDAAVSAADAAVTRRIFCLDLGVKMKKQGERKKNVEKARWSTGITTPSTYGCIKKFRGNALFDSVLSHLEPGPGEKMSFKEICAYLGWPWIAEAAFFNTKSTPMPDVLGREISQTPVYETYLN